MAAKKSAGKKGTVRRRAVRGGEPGESGDSRSRGEMSGEYGDLRSLGEVSGESGDSRSLGGYREEYAGQVVMLCRLGARDEEVAGFFGVGVELLDEWRRDHVEFAEGMRRGRLLADAEVAERLFMRARGYSHEAVKIMQRAGEPVIVPYVEHYPPDTTACVFWLKNRRPDLWREKVTEDGAGKKGGAVELTVGEEALAAIAEAAGIAARVVGPGERSGAAGKVP